MDIDQCHLSIPSTEASPQEGFFYYGRKKKENNRKHIFLPLSLGFILGLAGLLDLCPEEFFFLFFLVADGSPEWHHWNNWKNLRFLLGTIVSVNSESCFRTGKSGLRFFFSAGMTALVGSVGAKALAADAKAAAYEVGILGSSTSSPWKEKYQKMERETLTIMKTKSAFVGPQIRLIGGGGYLWFSGLSHHYGGALSFLDGIEKH